MGSSVRIFNRNVTQQELDRIQAGVEEHAIDRGAAQTSERFGTVALEGERFVGAASGLAAKSGAGYSRWFQLTDLFVEENYRGRGIGSELIVLLELAVVQIGVRSIWTWTAGHEGARAFYLKHGYEIFAEFERYYSNGANRLGLRKTLRANTLRP